MITGIIIASFLVILTIGLIKIYRRHSRFINRIEFSNEYRNKFIDFSNIYFRSYDKWNRSGEINGELYNWLTLNVTKIQNSLGSFGRMSYKPAFQNYIISNYQIIINSLPKFREGQITDIDVNSVDDCLLRYIGYLNESILKSSSDLKNPIVWFREGIKEVISIPLLILNWFGIFSNNTINKITDSLIYKVMSGLIALVTLLSGIITIIVGYDQTMTFISKILTR